MYIFLFEVVEKKLVYLHWWKCRPYSLVKTTIFMKRYVSWFQWNHLVIIHLNFCMLITSIVEQEDLQQKIHNQTYGAIYFLMLNGTYRHIYSVQHRQKSKILYWVICKESISYKQLYYQLFRNITENDKNKIIK